uniref:Uncharacterized protein n=1 Tax=Plectus sambesii TaxID=2011161 RepID=A0A914WDF3_9BILA
MTATATDMRETPRARIICTNSMQCTDLHSAQWKAKQRSLQWRVRSNPQFGNRSRYVGDEFCWNAHDAGFLLDEEALTWPIACVWMGGEEETGACSPAPPAAIFGYIGQQQWRDRLVNIRTAVGCRREAVEAARHASELYYCRARCVQAGIGYLPSFIAMASTLLTFFCIFGRHR